LYDNTPGFAMSININISEQIDAANPPTNDLSTFQAARVADQA